LADLPIKQDFAVTGSVNQQGQIQPIGGVNEKIEGFFDTCRARGFTGDQGVIIPAANTPNLMLRQDVVEAVRANQFAIYPVTTVDEGISLLTGVSAGRADEQGEYPPDSVNGRVLARLALFAKKQQEFSAPKKESETMSNDKGEETSEGNHAHSEGSV
jgi:predicted ATP-dependent protease